MVAADKWISHWSFAYCCSAYVTYFFFLLCVLGFFFAVLQNLVQDSCLVSAVSSCFGSLTCPEDSGRGKSLGSPSAASA